jgi:hypothetical protein
MNHISFDHFSMVEIDYSEAISVNLQIINHKKSSVQRKKPKMGKKQRIVMLSV